MDLDFEAQELEKFVGFFEWDPLRCTTHDEKGPCPYCNPFLPHILISIKNNESKAVKCF